MLTKIISGGQTGADVAGLIAAKNCGLRTGGFINRGFKTELGSMPQLGKEFFLIEINSLQYPHRTLMNVQTGDATVIFHYGKLEKGSALTKSYCERLDKPYLVMPLDDMCDNNYGFMLQELRKLILDNKVSILNVAGNRESVAPGIQAAVIFLLTKLFAVMYNNKELEKYEQI